MQSFIEDSAQFQNSKSQPNTYVGKYFSDQQQKMKTMKEEVWKGIIAILYTGSPECSQSTQWACNWDTRLIGHYFPGVFTSDESLNRALDNLFRIGGKCKGKQTGNIVQYHRRLKTMLDGRRQRAWRVNGNKLLGLWPVFEKYRAGLTIVMLASDAALVSTLLIF